ncbi:hypothetical protein TKK_0014098 [Trichogramma kaykai]|uniref:BEN domain-containing protein n=1 Tax=Trichogramma kaykai TaxID=54128 RepID=A0ABD2WH40_9HYME
MANKNLYYLVLWSNAKNISILSASEIKNAENPESVKGKWDSKWYDIKVIKTSHDLNFLEKLEVDTDGNIMTKKRRESFPNSVILEKRKYISQEKEKAKSRNRVRQQHNAAFSKHKSIFSESSEEEEDTELHVPQSSTRVRDGSHEVRKETLEQCQSLEIESRKMQKTSEKNSRPKENKNDDSKKNSKSEPHRKIPEKKVSRPSTRDKNGAHEVRKETLEQCQSPEIESRKMQKTPEKNSRPKENKNDDSKKNSKSEPHRKIPEKQVSRPSTRDKNGAHEVRKETLEQCQSPEIESRKMQKTPEKNSRPKENKNDDSKKKFKSEPHRKIPEKKVPESCSKVEKKTAEMGVKSGKKRPSPERKSNERPMTSKKIHLEQKNKIDETEDDDDGEPSADMLEEQVPESCSKVEKKTAEMGVKSGKKRPSPERKSNERPTTSKKVHLEQKNKTDETEDDDDGEPSADMLAEQAETDANENLDEASQEEENNENEFKSNKRKDTEEFNDTDADEQTQKRSRKSADKDEELRKNLVSFHREKGKVKLYPGYNIYINAAELQFLKDKWRNKPRDLARQLFRLIIGPSNLKKMTATGRAGTTEVPNDVFKAVFGYVNKKVQDKKKMIPSHEFTRLVTSLLSTLRNPRRPEETKKNKKIY